MKLKCPRAAALAVAKELCDYLKPFCMPDRLKVCGSLRRMKKEVGDVEVLYIGKLEDRQEGLFDKKPFDLAEEAIGKLLLNGVLEKRLNIRGIATWGPLNKLSTQRKSAIPVDLFAAIAPHWWVTVLVRTGSKEFNIRMIAALAERKFCLHAYGQSGITHMDTGEDVPITSEEQIFHLAGIPYLEPHERI